MAGSGRPKTGNATTVLTKRNGPGRSLLSTFHNRSGGATTTATKETKSMTATATARTATARTATARTAAATTGRTEKTEKTAAAAASAAPGSAQDGALELARVAARKRGPSPPVDAEPLSSDDELASQSELRARNNSQSQKSQTVSAKFHGASMPRAQRQSPGVNDEPMSSSDDELSQSQQQEQQQQKREQQGQRGQRGRGYPQTRGQLTRSIRPPRFGGKYRRFGEPEDSEEDKAGENGETTVASEGKANGSQSSSSSSAASSGLPSQKSGGKRPSAATDGAGDELTDEYGWIISSQSSGRARQKRLRYSGSVSNIHTKSSQTGRAQKYGKEGRSKSREQSTGSEGNSSGASNGQTGSKPNDHKFVDPLEKHYALQKRLQTSGNGDEEDDNTSSKAQFRMPKYEQRHEPSDTPINKPEFTMPPLTDTPWHKSQIRSKDSQPSNNSPKLPRATFKHFDVDALAGKILTDKKHTKDIESLFQDSTNSPPSSSQPNSQANNNYDSSAGDAYPFFSRSSSIALSSLPSSPSAVSFDNNDDNDDTPRPKYSRTSPPTHPPNHRNTRSSSPSPRCPFCRTPVDTAFWETHGEGMNMAKLKNQMRFCRMHKEQSSKLEWAAKGYPTIDWARLPARLEKYHPRILAVLENSQPSYYRNVLETTMKSGKNRTLAQSIMASTFHELTPGYYGSRGARVMMDHIMTHFAPQIRKAVSSDRVAAFGGPSGFVQAVLVPELAVMLVKEDMHIPDRPNNSNSNSYSNSNSNNSSNSTSHSNFNSNSQSNDNGDRDNDKDTRDNESSDEQARRILRESIEIGDLLNEEEEDRVHAIQFDHGFGGREIIS